jgi:riboflavin synthase alpha subunit
MFTGLIRELGTVERVTRAGGLIRLSVFAPKTAADARRLDSVAVNGVCLSVVTAGRQGFAFEIIPETARLTTLGRLRPGDAVNLEPSLTLTDRLGGHFLFGHVDGVGIVSERRVRGGETILTIRLEPGLRRFLVPKGPVALEGVSLTVGQELSGSAFSVHLIPETHRQTTLGALQRGDRVNLEIDYLAKLVWQFTPPRGAGFTGSGNSAAAARRPGRAGRIPARRR